MKLTFTKTLSTAMLLSGMAIAQTNSVSLRDGSGTVISTHSSITDAYAAITPTLTQAYTIELTSAYTGGTEVYPIVFVAKSGASAANTITLRPAAGVTSMSVQASVASNAILKLSDADYVIIDGRPGGTGTTGVLMFNNLNTGYSTSTIQLINGACFNQIRYCKIQNEAVNGTGTNISLSTSTNTSGNSDNLVKYCDIESGRYQVAGTGTTANPNTRNTFFGCNFRNGRFVSYWGQAGTGKVRIDSCTFSSTAAVNESLYYGVLFDSQSDSAILANNRFYDLQVTGTGTVRYVHVRSVAATGTNVAEIRNNFFSVMAGNGSTANLAAIEISSGSALFKARIAHNSVRIGGTLASGGGSGNVGSSGLLLSSTNASSVFDIKNNLFVNERSGGIAGLQHLGVALTGTASVINLSGNTYNSVSGNLTRWGTTVNTSIAAHQGIVPGGEPTANDAPVSYLSATNLHLACSAIGNTSLTATQIPGISTDIDGATRGSTTYRGADEPGSSTVSLSLAGQSNPTCNGQSSGSATVTASGSSGYTYNWVPSGGAAAAATGLAAGNYTVTVTDGSGCTATQTVAITQPAAIITLASTLSNVTCNGLMNGSASVSASGGTGTLTYSWSPSGGNAATASGLGAGNYTVTVKDANNCSNTNVVTVSEPPPVDPSVMQNGLVITANTAGASYQWINCATNSPIAGQASQSFTATANGNYKVTVTVAGCAATSSCVAITGVGIKENTQIAGLQVYPNPGTGLYTLFVPVDASIAVSNVIGEVILRGTAGIGESQLDLSRQASGIYYVQVTAGNRSSVLKVVKQ